MKKKKLNLRESLSFLFPSYTIKKNGFSKKDVKNISNNLTLSFSYVYLIVSLILVVLMSSLFAYMMIDSKGNFIDKYGLMGLIGLMILIFGALGTIFLVVLAKTRKEEKNAIRIARFAGDFLYACTSSYLLCCIFADAERGFTTNSETLSASIIFIAVLLLIQSMQWIDAMILDVGTTFGIIGVTVYCSRVYDMKAIHYYGLIAVLYPFAAYLIIALLFFAESQRYKESLENDRLHNRAYYDSLTHCKNRYALAEFLKENQSRWENKDNSNLLIVLFDIDDFRLYNNQFSHLGGDYCLKTMCDAIRREFVSPDLDFFRYGGEEFLLFFELKDQKEAPEYLRRVRQAINTLDIQAPKGAPKEMVTISIGGLFLHSMESFEFEQEMKIVDDYLYKAKASGKDVVCYNGSIMN